MPNKDGKGPLGQGSGGGAAGQGPSGYCICPSCGIKVEHQPGIPCNSLQCSKCGAKLIRE